MPYEYYIDVLKEDYERKNLIINEDDYKSYFVNILRYIHKRYGIKVTELSRILNVKRQTMYNYFKVSTFSLPKLVIDKIVLVYGLKSIQSVLELELAVEFHPQILNIIQSKVDDGIEFNKIKSKYKYLFDVNSNVPGLRTVYLKNEYDFRIKWAAAANLGLSTSIDTKSNHLTVLYEQFILKNDVNYCKKVLELIASFESNDMTFMSILKLYYHDKYKLFK